MNQDQQGDQAVQAIADWMRHVDQDGYYGGEPGAVHAQRDARDLYRSVVAPLLADRDAEAKRLRDRIHEAVDETQRRYAKYQSRCASFDTWAKWAREHAERMGDHFWTHTSQVHRLYVMSLHEEIERLRREVEFWANGADTFSGADELAEGGSQCSVHPDGGGA